MTTRVRTRNTWFISMALFIALGLMFASCNSDDGGNPIAPQGGENSDFVASQGQTDKWGAYYEKGDASFYVNIPEAGDYQLKYAVIGAGPFYITFNTPEPAILEVGLRPGDVLDYACVSSGAIAVPEETANVGIKHSWRVTVYSITDDDGDNVSWWNPGSDAQTLFTAEPNGENPCVIEDGKLGDGIERIDPPNKGGDSGDNGGGTTPPPAGTYNITVTYGGTCATPAAVTCTPDAGATCTPMSRTSSGTFNVSPDTASATLTITGTSGCAGGSIGMIPASGSTYSKGGTTSATVTDNDAGASTVELTVKLTWNNKYATAANIDLQGQENGGGGWKTAAGDGGTNPSVLFTTGDVTAGQACDNGTTPPTCATGTGVESFTINATSLNAPYLIGLDNPETTGHGSSVDVCIKTHAETRVYENCITDVANARFGAGTGGQLASVAFPSGAVTLSYGGNLAGVGAGCTEAAGSPFAAGTACP